MNQPINYLAMLPQVDAGGQFAQGMAQGLQANQLMQQQKVLEQQQQDAINKQKMAQQYQADAEFLKGNFNKKNLMSFILAYPTHSDKYKPVIESLDNDIKQNEMVLSTRALNSIASGDIDGAKSVFDEIITATDNSGRSTSALKSMREKLDTNPKSVAFELGSYRNALNPDQVKKELDAENARAEEARKAELHPSMVKEAGVKADYAEKIAKAELTQKEWAAKKLQADIDIDRQNAKINSLNAALAKESNDLKRQELGLKLEGMKNDLETKKEERTSSGKSALMSADNMINTIERALATPMSVIGSAAGPVSARLPTVLQSTSDFEKLAETIGSQAFLTQVPVVSGMGSLSNAEGEKLTAALQSFSLAQSPERLVENLKEARRLIYKSRNYIAKKYGVENTTPDLPNAQAPSKDRIDEIMSKYGGAK